MKKTLLLSSAVSSAVLAGGLLFSATAGAMSSAPKTDPITDFQNSWAGKALAHQRSLDMKSPLADNNILGSHNSYNSEVYSDPLSGPTTEAFHLRSDAHRCAFC